METNRLDRPNKSPVKFAEPPTDLRGSGTWTALQYWMERSVTGHLTMVVCDGCGSTYWGKWEVLIHKDGPNTLVPILTGGMVWDSNGNSWSCTCPGGRPWRKAFPKAPPGVIQKSMEVADALSVEGAAMISSPGGPGKLLRDMMENMKSKSVRVAAQGADPDTRTAVLGNLMTIMERPNVIKGLEYLKVVEPSAVARLWKVYEGVVEYLLTGGDMEEGRRTLIDAVKATLELARKHWKQGRRIEKTKTDAEPTQESLAGHHETPPPRPPGYPETWEDVLKTTSTRDDGGHPRREDGGVDAQEEAGPGGNPPGGPTPGVEKGDTGNTPENHDGDGDGPAGPELAPPPVEGDGVTEETVGGQGSR